MPEQETKKIEEPVAMEASIVSEKRKAEDVASPDNKRQKSDAPDAAVLRKQVEYYLSDQNLQFDKFFHEKITADKDGWLEMSFVLSCNKMKALRATQDLVFAALKNSLIEIRNIEGSAAALRRPGNKALPAIQERAGAGHVQKKKPNAHAGGVIIIVKNIPEEQTWMQVKDALRAKLPEKASIMFASAVSDKNQCVLAATPFLGDVEMLEGFELEVGGAKLKLEVCYGDVLQQALKLLPKNVRERREKQARNKLREMSKPIVLANQRFPNPGAVRGRIKTVLSSRSDGEQLNAEGSDYKLVHALLKFHPTFEKKTAGMTGIRVDKSEMGTSRCFWIVKGDKAEDFSANKCLVALELNPPFADTPPKAATEKKEEAATEKKAEVATEKKEDAATEKKEEEAAEKKEEAATEKKE